ncbi:MAG: hypothetical protein Q8O09_06125 [Bacillota bacterium]|nr:hypothetical protein [Bacillota bacterium]
MLKRPHAPLGGRFSHGGISGRHASSHIGAPSLCPADPVLLFPVMALLFRYL